MTNTAEDERAKLVLWKSPIRTTYYFTLQLFIELIKLIKLVLANVGLVILGAILTVGLLVAVQFGGPHQQYIQMVRSEFSWCIYWVGLGVLSSVGLGTGLHTFLLYLGPHIASVTIAAWECESTNFPSPPYPEKIICPDDETPMLINILTIMSKVRLEAFMWGAGTALGELPPYFMARAARLSGQKLDDEDFNEVESMKNREDLGIWSKTKLFMHSLVQKAGFVGILVCASIPNPLFDLAGITCGHFLVPFTTFFGATLIGKAVFKMHIQMTFVILMFTKHHLEGLVNLVAAIPVVGPTLHKPFVEYMENQKLKLHSGGKQGSSSESMVSKVYEVLVIFMIGYFVLSIVNSMAQQYHKENVSEKKQK